MAAPKSKVDSREQYIVSGARPLAEHERKGVAYTMSEVERYIVAIAAGKKPRKPKPGKG